MNLNPTCRHCGTRKVWIGIAGGAEAYCPRDCSECIVCRHPDAALRIVSAELVEREVPYLFSGFVGPSRFYVSTVVCSKCGARSTVERPVP